MINQAECSQISESGGRVLEEIIHRLNESRSVSVKNAFFNSTFLHAVQKCSMAPWCNSQSLQPYKL